MLVTIHQPDLMPWLGFFKKIHKANIWVILDHTVNNPRDSAFWGRRVKILISGEAKWLSLPLKKPTDKGVVGIPISEMKYNMAEAKLFRKALASVENSYRKAPFFSEVFPLVKEHLNSNEPSMSERNTTFITSVLNKLKIDTKILYSSGLNCVESSTDLLVEIIQATGGTSYLCGDGASGYQDDNLFMVNDIKLEYNNFQHPEYMQYGSTDFVPGLSIIDALMNIGFEGVRKLLDKN